MIHSRRQVLKFALAGGAAAMAPPAIATGDYPSKPIKVLISSAPGGPNDFPARLMANFLPPMLGQTVVVENRPGASGLLAIRELSSAAPDGHTLLIANTGTLAVLPAVSAAVAYDPAKAFVPVARMIEGFQILTVHPSSPWKSIEDLVGDAKASPGRFNFAHVGTGGLPHLTGELFAARTGVKLTGVSYRGGAANLNAVLGREVHMTFQDVGISLPLIRAGKLRALAVTSRTRSPLAPDLPTMTEAGVPDYEVTTYFGIVAPSGTPQSVVAKLNAAINKGMALPETQQTITALGLRFTAGSPAEFAAMAAADHRRWRQFVMAANIRID